MEFLSLKRNEKYKDYSYENASTVPMSILAIFLIDDVRSRSFSFRDWFYMHDHFVLSSNATFLEKEGNYILLSDLYDEDDPPTHIQLTHDQFLYLLDRWEKLYKEGPKQIVVIKDGDTITMTGLNDPDA